MNHTNIFNRYFPLHLIRVPEALKTNGNVTNTFSTDFLWHKRVQFPWELLVEVTPFHTLNEGSSSTEKGSSDTIILHYLWRNPKKLQSMSSQSDPASEQIEGEIAVKNAQHWKAQTDLRKEYPSVSLACQGYLRNMSYQENEGSDSGHEREVTKWKKHCSHLCNDPHTPGNDCSLCLSPTHPSESRSNKHLSGQVFCLQVATACIEHCELHATQYSNYQELVFLESLKFKDLLSLSQTEVETWGSLGPWSCFNLLRMKHVLKWCYEAICPDYVYFSHHEIG